MASQTRMAKVHELSGIFATVNGCSATVVTTVKPHRILPMLCRSHSVLVSRHINRGDEAVATPGDVDDEPMPVATIAQRATQCGHVDRQVGRFDKYIWPNPGHQVLLADQLTTAFKQSNQDLKSPTPERYGRVALPQKKLRRK